MTYPGRYKAMCDVRRTTCDSALKLIVQPGRVGLVPTPVRVRLHMGLYFILLLIAALPAQAQQEKLAQTGMKFLSVSVDARAAGLGDAMTALTSDAAALFYNPAGMAFQESGLNATFGQVQWIAEIDYNAAAVSFRPMNGRIGVFGVSLVAVDYGDLLGTVRADNEQGFEEIGTLTPTALSLGFGYARALTDRFSAGGQIKYVRQDLGTVPVDRSDEGGLIGESMALDVMAFDFGVLYKTGFRSLTFAVGARNFAQEVAYSEESFQLPLTLKIGLAMDVMDLMAAPEARNQAFLVSLEAENPRDFSEQIKIGGEYRFLDTFMLRAGYVFPTDEQGISLGAGFHKAVRGIGFGADYAYTNFGVFSNVQRLSLQFNF